MGETGRSPRGRRAPIDRDRRAARARVEEALRQSEERLRRASEAGGVALYEWYAQENTSWCSDMYCEMLGLPPGSRQTWEQWIASIHPDDRARVDAREREAMAHGTSHRHEYRIVRTDGGVRWVESAWTLERDAAGRPLVCRGVLHDITARKRLEAERDALLDSERAARAEAERANRMKDELLAVVSHELRTPLSSILGWAQLLRRGGVPAASLPRALEIIERNALVLSRLVSDLLDVSRFSTGKIQMEVSLADLGQAVEGALDDVQQTAADRGICLEQELAPGLLVLGDPARLRQIAWNLLSNAVKFSAGGGRVRVTLSAAGDRAVLRVEDEGPGIGPELLPRLFERFQQADASAARRHGGLGLGLSIVRHLCELHGGSVRAESAGEGRGSTFIVELPLWRPQGDEARAPEPSWPPPAEPDSGRAPLRGVSVLVVEDEADARELLRRLLSEAGAEVRTVGSAAEARAALSAAPPAALLSDLGMPDEDGFQLIRKIRATEAWRRLPAIAVTAFARPEDRARALAAGFDDFVTKPIEVAALVAALSRAITGE